MRIPARPAILALSLALIVAAGCNLPGRPKPGPEVPRPDEVTDFATLYGENCSACHGASGKRAVSTALADPVYIAYAGESNIQHITAAGIPGKLMPGFSHAAGGMLTDPQIQIIVHGIVTQWGNSASLDGQNPPSYLPSSQPDAKAGEAAFSHFCARCHGADGTGQKVSGKSTGSIVDPTYLDLISDQGLRTLTVTGLPDRGMPDWRGDDPGHPMTEKQVTDIVAWLASHRLPAGPKTASPQK